MMTIALVCAISATFLPPTDWKIVKIEPAVYRPADPTQVFLTNPPTYDKGHFAQATIHLTRQIKPGESVTPPAGCTPVLVGGK